MRAVSTLANLTHIELDVTYNKLGEQSGLYFSENIIKCSNMKTIKVNISNNSTETTHIGRNSILNLVELKKLVEL